jgi:hypothetical protein
MAASQAAHNIAQANGHDDNAITAQDVSNPEIDSEKYSDPSIKLEALAWMGKNKVQVSKLACVSARHSFTDIDS